MLQCQEVPSPLLESEQLLLLDWWQIGAKFQLSASSLVGFLPPPVFCLLVVSQNVDFLFFLFGSGAAE